MAISALSCTAIGALFGALAGMVLSIGALFGVEWNALLSRVLCIGCSYSDVVCLVGSVDIVFGAVDRYLWTIVLGLHGST